MYGTAYRRPAEQPAHQRHADERAAELGDNEARTVYGTDSREGGPARGGGTELPPHAPDTAIEAALDRCIATGVRSIIAFGGGSVLDAAKAVSRFHHLRRGRYLPIVALSTPLSGSEFSHYFGVSETFGLRPFKRS